MATTERMPTRERRPSTSAPIVDIQGSVGPAGISRPKHKRTFTGFGAGEIKGVEGIPPPGIGPPLHPPAPDTSLCFVAKMAELQ